MAKYWRNRTAKDWKDVLEAHGFRAFSSKNHGDDEVWCKTKKSMVILVPSRDSEVVKHPTSCRMASMADRYGVPKKAILQWWREHGYGE